MAGYFPVPAFFIKKVVLYDIGNLPDKSCISPVNHKLTFQDASG